MALHSPYLRAACTRPIEQHSTRAQMYATLSERVFLWTDGQCRRTSMFAPAHRVGAHHTHVPACSTGVHSCALVGAPHSLTQRSVPDGILRGFCRQGWHAFFVASVYRTRVLSCAGFSLNHILRQRPALRHTFPGQCARRAAPSSLFCCLGSRRSPPAHNFRCIGAQGEAKAHILPSVDELNAAPALLIRFV